MTEFIRNREIYEDVIRDAVPKAKHLLWIATADIKDMYVEHAGRMVPFLQILAGLLKCGVDIRLIHAKEPGPAFRRKRPGYRSLSCVQGGTPAITEVRPGFF